jgi:pyrroloquinoline-quinone synthase
LNTTNSFWNQFEARTAPYDLLQHSFYKAWTAGELTREDLRAYAAEYWHHVSAFPTYLSALHAHLPDGGMRRTVLENLADEEGIGSPDGRPHSDLWIDFLRGMGGDTAAQTLQPETQELINTFRCLMHAEPAAALAALYAYESRVPAIAREKAAGLTEHYGADAAATRYFTLHQTADVYHAKVWQDLINAELAAHPESAEAALQAAETAAKALWNTLDGIERERRIRNGITEPACCMN